MTEVSKLAVLGSTGSIGTQTLAVVRNNSDRFKVEALSAHRNTDLLLEQIAEFSPSYVAITDEQAARNVRNKISSSTKVLVGRESVNELTELDSIDVVVAALVGFAGLSSVLSAIEAGKDIAFANKEALVAGGSLVMNALSESGSKFIPIDSEHNSIFQCLLARRDGERLKKIIITASGGPFWNVDVDFDSITPAQALRHPRWNMGAKNSLDSATMMNKALEVIEAAWLFELDRNEIDVLVHPQSIVHGLIEFEDGMVLAALSETDMRIPISFALGYLNGGLSDMHGGARVSCSGASVLDLAKHGSLEFSAPNHSRFPALQLADEALRLGGVAPAVFNAANEVAGEAFLEGELKFGQISDIVAKTLGKFQDFSAAQCVDDIIEADKRARGLASSLLV